MKRAILTVLLATLAGCVRYASPEEQAKIRPFEEGAAWANNAFCADLLHRFAGGTGNVFFSPYSISTGLAMVWHGSQGQTADEIAQVLHLSDNDLALKYGFTNLDAMLIFETTRYEEGILSLYVANGLWVQKGRHLLAKYLDQMQNSATVEEVDFASAPEAARQKINSWTASKTQQRIQATLPPGSLTPDTRLVLSNAIYFKGQWVHPFLPQRTAVGEFRTLHGESVKVPLMHQKARFRYTEDENCQALKMYYVGQEFWMLVLLPNLPSEKKVEETITGDYLRELMGNMSETEVDVTLPKWRAAQEFDLSVTLQKMGVKQVFSAAADFSGMTGEKGLYLSQARHKAWVEVNEEGTEATAATFFAAKSAAPVCFRADRPFLYFIYHATTGAILFAGRLADPSKTE